VVLTFQRLGEESAPLSRSHREGWPGRRPRWFLERRRCHRSRSGCRLCGLVNRRQGIRL